FQSNLRLAHKIIEYSLDGIILLNADGIIEYVNPTFTNVTGYSADEAIGKTPNLLKSGRHDQEYYTQMWQTLSETGYWQGEIWNRRKNGSIYPEWLTITAIRDDEGQIQQYAGIFADISDRKEKEKAIRKMAFFDDLTGLPNRRLFRDRLMVALARAKRHNEYLAIMFLDLDHFKKINDTLGHVVGDTLLVEASQRIKECLREEDTVARLGGDEFILLFPDIENIDEVIKIAERVNHSFNQPYTIDGHELYVTSSIGISISPDDGNDADTLIKNADAAMYRSKDEGRNKFNLFSPIFTAHGKRHLQVENALRQALKNDELTMVFQPKVKAWNGEITGVEALARWENKELGFISPVEFIPLAENIGLISKIGVWALRSACKIMKEWREAGHPLISVAVNISAIQAVESTFPQSVAAILSEFEIPAKYLEIEITESTFLKDFDIVRNNLEALKGLGASISMDDFGTGFSSLSYLNRIPLDYLKIDRSFVSKMFMEEESLELVATIISMAKNLGLKTIAEGVETQEQADLLNDKGCHLLQGYLYSKPISAKEIAKKYWK
ncbi:MAG: EAL domain-containing protein, partial [Alphaproteobacteria bacterium]|nr:EAL domain-containing protein [Alphaproteobacteria bacterium]